MLPPQKLYVKINIMLGGSFPRYTYPVCEVMIGNAVLLLTLMCMCLGYGSEKQLIDWGWVTSSFIWLCLITGCDTMAFPWWHLIGPEIYSNDKAKMESYWGEKCLCFIPPLFVLGYIYLIVIKTLLHQALCITAHAHVSFHSLFAICLAKCIP